MSDDLDSKKITTGTHLQMQYLIDISKFQGNPIKKMKADENGVFYVKKEIPID